MIQFFARVVELREEKCVKCDGKITVDFPSREFLEVTLNVWYEGLQPFHLCRQFVEEKSFTKPKNYFTQYKLISHAGTPAMRRR